MKNQKLTLPKWQYSKRIPPDWVREAFAIMGTDYKNIAINFSNNIDAFMHDSIIGEIENALPSTEDNKEAYCPLTAYDRKVAFMMAAIKHAEYCRLIPTSEKPKVKDSEKNNELRKAPELLGSANVKTDTIIRHDIMNDYRQLVKIRVSISETVKILSKQLQDLHEHSNRLGLECMNYEYILEQDLPKRSKRLDLECMVYEEILDEDCLIIHPIPHQHKLTNILNRLEQMCVKPLDYPVKHEVLLGIDLNSPSSFFVRSFSIWLSQNTELIGGVLDTKALSLTDLCWATIATSLLNHDINIKKILSYKKVPVIIDPRTKEEIAHRKNLLIQTNQMKQQLARPPAFTQEPPTGPKRSLAFHLSLHSKTRD